MSNNTKQPATANDGTPKGMPPTPKDKIVNPYPDAPAMKQTRNTGEIPRGSSYLRNHLNNPNKD